MRNDLRSQLQELVRTSSGRLHAAYSAADDGALVDTENVLLYNVGGKALRPLMAHGVTFERRYQVPPPPPGGSLPNDKPLHHHRYSVTRATAVEYWIPGKSLCAFVDVPVGSVDKPAPVWNAIREYATAPIKTASAPMRFLINLQITDTQYPGGGSVASIVKPVLDGIISAYHGHDGSDGFAEAQRLEATGIGAAEILQKHLLDQSWAALGARRLVKPFGAKGVQWNPADEFCVHAHITLITGRAVADEHPARWRLTAELIEATR